MPLFDITFMGVDRDQDPTVVEGFLRAVDWPLLPREGESIDLAEGLDPLIVESVGYTVDGYPNVFTGRVVLDDLQVAQLRRRGWTVRGLPVGGR